MLKDQRSRCILKSKAKERRSSLDPDYGDIMVQKNAVVPENHWYEEMVGIKVGLAPKYR
jgi:hypothetical protein